MNLSYVYMPVRDLKSSLAFYRDVLGCEEVWREGESTAAIRAGDGAMLMLDEDRVDVKAGPFITVESVVKFYDEHKGSVPFLAEPREIPPGMYVAFTDPSGNVVRLMDASKER